MAPDPNEEETLPADLPENGGEHPTEDKGTGLKIRNFG